MLQAETTTYLEVVHAIIVGDALGTALETAQSIKREDVPEPLQHVISYAAGVPLGRADTEPERVLQELRWELGESIMALAYGDQEWKITPLDYIPSEESTS